MATNATKGREASPSGRRLLLVASGNAEPAPPPSGLEGLGWRIQPAADARDALRLLRNERTQPHAALFDLRAGFDDKQLAAFAPALSAPNAGWVAGVAADQLDEPAIRRLIRDYCYDYVTLPCPDAVLNTVVGHAHGMSVLACERGSVHAALDQDDIIGDCPAMQGLSRHLYKAAQTDAPVFIAGETGTGKELAARALHRNSRRKAKPFVAINCGAIPANLVQSELFGYERGAFTGAQARKIGRFERADGGTLFLDEIGDLPAEAQASLLRFLQEGCFERLGGHESIHVDVRIISATHHDLESAVASGSFRADLYHRLCVLRLRQPPLRERGEDIDRLADHALARYCDEGQHAIRGFAPCARRAIHAYQWPGNVRELINRVRQAVVMAEGRLITAADLRLEPPTDAPATLEEARDAAARGAIEEALQRNRGRMVDAARELAVSRVTLYRLMGRYGMRAANGPPSEAAHA
jgi:DNA-binding NtrC family response regulator